MTDHERALATDLMDRAICNTDHPAKAASLLMSAAASILQKHFGPALAAGLMSAALDAAGPALALDPPAGTA